MDKKRSISLYDTMLKIRMVEEAIAELYPQQQIRCPVHLCIGQEAVAAGVCSNLKKDDYVMSNHRSHGHYIAKGGDIKAMMAEIYGKATGCCKGKGGSMHLVDLTVNYLGSTPIVGGTIPVATGVAFGIKLKKIKGKVAVIFLGDAATEEGVFSESLNFAALKKLPIVFVSENNLYSVYSPLSVRQPEERDNVKLAKAYGIFSDRGNGNDVEEVSRITVKAVEYARAGKGPVFLELSTYRFREHCGPNYDNDLGYRTQKEFRAWLKKCPLENYEKMLLKNGLLDERKIAAMKEKMQAEIDDAVVFAKNSPFPDIKEIMSDVYSNEVGE